MPPSTPLRSRVRTHRIEVCPSCGAARAVDPLVRGRTRCALCGHHYRLRPGPAVSADGVKQKLTAVVAKRQ